MKHLNQLFLKLGIPPWLVEESLGGEHRQVPNVKSFQQARSIHFAGKSKGDGALVLQGERAMINSAHSFEDAATTFMLIPAATPNGMMAFELLLTLMNKDSAEKLGHYYVLIKNKNLFPWNGEQRFLNRWNGVITTLVGSLSAQEILRLAPAGSPIRHQTLSSLSCKEVIESLISEVQLNGGTQGDLMILILARARIEGWKPKGEEQEHKP